MALSYTPAEALARGFLETEASSSLAESVRIIPIDDRGATAGPIRIGRNVIVRDGCILCSGVSVGDNTVIGNNSVIRSGVHIGQDCVLSHLVCVEGLAFLDDRVRVAALTHLTGGCVLEPDVRIGARVAAVTDHSLPWHPGPQPEGRPPIFRNACRIGSGSTILGDVEIGAHTVVAAGSLVTRSLPPGVVAYGVPASIQRDS